MSLDMTRELAISLWQPLQQGLYRRPIAWTHWLSRGSSYEGSHRGRTTWSNSKGSSRSTRPQPAVVMHAFNPRTGGRDKRISESKASLVYRVSPKKHCLENQDPWAVAPDERTELSLSKTRFLQIIFFQRNLGGKWLRDFEDNIQSQQTWEIRSTW